jgi:hypothetical protein
MPFTNIWDDVFPPDTQLANQLGLDLRNFRTDTQERMAAISGLDAAKPNFAGDAQPANWNGILFFALDTGKVYQFNNPTWTDVTPSIGIGKLFQTAAVIVHTGTTSLDDIYTFSVPSWATGNTIRIKFGMAVMVQGGTNTTLKLYSQGHGTLLASLAWNTNIATSVIEIMIANGAGNNGFTMMDRVSALAPTTQTANVGFAGLALTQLIVSIQNGSNSDSQNFGPCLAEFIP